jgi:hypothetical protein
MLSFVLLSFLYSAYLGIRVLFFSLPYRAFGLSQTLNPVVWHTTLQDNLFSSVPVPAVALDMKDNESGERKFPAFAR